MKITALFFSLFAAIESNASISYVGSAINSKHVVGGVGDSIVLTYAAAHGNCLLVTIGGANGVGATFTSVSASDSASDTFVLRGNIISGYHAVVDQPFTTNQTNNNVAMLSTSETGSSITSTITVSFTSSVTETVWATVAEYSGAAALGGIQFWTGPNVAIGHYGYFPTGAYGFPIVDDGNIVTLGIGGGCISLKTPVSGNVRRQGVSAADFAPGSYGAAWDGTALKAGNSVKIESTNNSGMTSYMGIAMELRSGSTNSTFTYTPTATVTGTNTVTATSTPTATSYGSSTVTVTASSTATVSATATISPSSSNTPTMTIEQENVAQWGGVNTSLGQKAMATSVPVVIASDQSAITVNVGAVSASIAIHSDGTPLPVQTIIVQNIQTPVVVQNVLTPVVVATLGAVPVTGTFFQATQPVHLDGTPIAAFTPSANWPVSGTLAIFTPSAGLPVTGPIAIYTPSAPISVNTPAAAFPVSGTISINTPTANLPVSGTLSVNTPTANWPITGTVSINTPTAPLSINTPTAALPVSGTFWQANQPVIEPFNTRSDTFTTTGNGTTVTVTTAPLSCFSIQVTQTGTVTSWDVRLEGSLDGTTWTQILQHTQVTGSGTTVYSGSVKSGNLYFRSRCAGLVLGVGTNVVAVILGMQ